MLAPDKSKLLPGSVFVTPTSPPPSTVAQPVLPQVESTLEDESIQSGVSPTQIARPNLLPSLSSSDVLFPPLEFTFEFTPLETQPDLQLDTSSEMEYTQQLNTTNEFESSSV